MRSLLLFFVLALFNISVFASSYQVEAVIFQNQNSSDQEIVEAGLDMSALNNSINLDADNGANDSFKELSSGFYKLTGIYNELKYSKNYRPIMHVSWEQPALNSSKARYVQVRSLEGQGESGDPLIKLDGAIRIRSSQFLHADVDLFYLVKSIPESMLQTIINMGSGATIESGYAELKETRRMKLNELHYFDHPAFGLLLRVSRFGE